VRFSDYSSLTVCDIPGLVEGAHLNVGLGHEFLRHVERTHVLAFVLDAASTDQDPCDAFRVLAAELDHYDARMRQKKRCVVIANKMDVEGAEQGLARVREMLAPTGTPVFGISALKKTGLEDLLLHLRTAVLGKDKRD
jgi:GTP-binding protein